MSPQLLIAELFPSTAGTARIIEPGFSWDGYILGWMHFGRNLIFRNILNLDFLCSTNELGASEKSQYVYSKGNLFIVN